MQVQAHGGQWAQGCHQEPFSELTARLSDHVTDSSAYWRDRLDEAVTAHRNMHSEAIVESARISKRPTQGQRRARIQPKAATLSEGRRTLPSAVGQAAQRGYEAQHVTSASVRIARGGLWEGWNGLGANGVRQDVNATQASSTE